LKNLLFEINNQLKMAGSQAEESREYFEIKKDYKEIALNSAKAALEGFNITYKELNEQQEGEGK